MALHFASAGVHAPHSDETLGPTATRGSPHSARRLRSLAFLCSSDEVRRQEVKRAPELRHTRYIWLKHKHVWSNRQKAPFAELKRRNLKTHRGFRIQETLREIFHSAQSAAQAKPPLNR